MALEVYLFGGDTGIFEDTSRYFVYIPAKNLIFEKTIPDMHEGHPTWGMGIPCKEDVGIFNKLIKKKDKTYLGKFELKEKEFERLKKLGKFYMQGKNFIDELDNLLKKYLK